MAAKLVTSDKIRNVAVIGHSSTGKTTLISTVAFCAKELNRLGKVDKGTAITDFDEESIERRITIAAAVAHAHHQGCKLNLIDTPGYSIFTTEAVQGIKVAEAALMMVSAVAGPEVQTEKLWKVCAGMAKPVILAVNLMDRERASAARTLQQLQKKLGREVIPIQVPIGEEQKFCGVIDLVHLKAFQFPADESGQALEVPIPTDLEDEVEAARSQLVEMVAEQDEALLEKFFAEGTLSEADLAEGLAKATAARKVFPLVYCSGGRNLGVLPLMDILVTLVPNPLTVAFSARNLAGDELELQPKPDDTPIAYVFKTISDPYAGRITILRVFSGSLSSDGTYYNRQRDVVERFGAVNWMQGKDLAPVEKLVTGDIGAVAKLKETRTGETLSSKDGAVLISPVPIPEAAISFAITAKTKGDEDKVAQGLQRLQEEDPTLHLGRDPQTKEQLVAGAGQLHVEIAVARLRRRFKVDVTLQAPKVPYRETITKTVEITSRHKKQTGGHGQFAEAKIRIEPLPRSGGYEFVDKIFGGSISQNYRPSVDKGIQDAASRGAISGHPVVDFRVVLLDGKEHAVDSSDMAFQICGRKAFKEAVKQAGPTILEPIMQVEITAPDEFLGDLMGDLNSRRGRVQGMDPGDGQTVIRAQVPLAEMLTYSQTLRSITSGRGDFRMESSHYDEVPRNLQEKIIAAAAGLAEEEEEE
ncbi:MAG TPA: elongation factor G [Thermoanaerobaculaceae bacterium]|nr:elongation factor G [Acidobacteriota bacterium]NLH11774.1 elongation factor G [Holophagae bacterium]HPW56885.1 elongation factor G [Thermoanaerobaculaceae bacterium]